MQYGFIRLKWYHKNVVFEENRFDFAENVYTINNKKKEKNLAFAIMKCVNLIIGAKVSCIETNEQKLKIQQTKSEYWINKLLLSPPLIWRY